MDHWTDGDDKLLLHLCSVTELPWTSVVHYFRHADQEALKRRLKEIQASSTTTGTDSPQPPIARPNSYCPLNHLFFSKRGSRKTTPRHRTLSGKACSKYSPSARRRQRSEMANRTRLTSIAPSDACARVSCSGRPHIPPFKHWAGEGYVWCRGEVTSVLRTAETS